MRPGGHDQRHVGRQLGPLGQPAQQTGGSGAVGELVQGVEQDHDPRRRVLGEQDLGRSDQRQVGQVGGLQEPRLQTRGGDLDPADGSGDLAELLVQVQARGPVERRDRQVLDPDPDDAAVGQDRVDVLADHHLETLRLEQPGAVAGELVSDLQEEGLHVPAGECGAAVPPGEVAEPVGVGAGEACEQARLARAGLARHQDVAAVRPLDPFVEPAALDELRSGTGADEVLEGSVDTVHGALRPGPGAGSEVDPDDLAALFHPLRPHVALDGAGGPFGPYGGDVARHLVGVDPATHHRRRLRSSRLSRLSGEEQRRAVDRLQDPAQGVDAAQEFPVGGGHGIDTGGVFVEIGPQPAQFRLEALHEDRVGRGEFARLGDDRWGGRALFGGARLCGTLAASRQQRARLVVEEPDAFGQDGHGHGGEG